MARIGFIGVGKMGRPMVKNLLSAGHDVTAYDVVPAALDAAEAAGCARAANAGEAAEAGEVVITMLPEGGIVRAIYLTDARLIDVARPGTLLVDCSTIDVETARAVHETAREAGLEMLDAPVSGGVAGAEAAALTFMVGGEAGAFARAEPILAAMGKTVVHAGPAGNGQAAKICNNMILGISMIAVSEAFTLAERLGLEAKKLYEISSQASGQCWSLSKYVPVPGVLPNVPANHDYKPGFTAAMMLKDLDLAQGAARASGAATPLGAEAAAIYARFCDAGNADLDFSGIIKLIAGKGE